MTSKRKAKKDISIVTRRKLPAYAREMVAWITGREEYFKVSELKELLDSFARPKSVSNVIFSRLQREWAHRHRLSVHPCRRCRQQFDLSLPS